MAVFGYIEVVDTSSPSSCKPRRRCSLLDVAHTPTFAMAVCAAFSITVHSVFFLPEFLDSYGQTKQIKPQIKPSR